LEISVFCRGNPYLISSYKKLKLFSEISKIAQKDFLAK